MRHSGNWLVTDSMVGETANCLGRYYKTMSTKTILKLKQNHARSKNCRKRKNCLILVLQEPAAIKGLLLSQRIWRRISQRSFTYTLQTEYSTDRSQIQKCLGEDATEMRINYMNPNQHLSFGGRRNCHWPIAKRRRIACVNCNACRYRT